MRTGINSLAFSKAAASHFIRYNFARIHETLRITPAMAAGLSNHAWTIAELIAIMLEAKVETRGPYKKRISS
jgi:hypothetical protein